MATVSGPNSIKSFDQLKYKIREGNGRYEISSADYKIVFHTSGDVQHIDQSDQRLDVNSMTILNGISSLSTLVTQEMLERQGNVAALAQSFLESPYQIHDPPAETQYIENQIQRNLGIDPLIAYQTAIDSGGTKAVTPKKLNAEWNVDLWRAQYLSTILNCRVEHKLMLDAISGFNKNFTIGDVFPSPNDFIDLLEQHFSRGFLIARLTSEYFARYEIGPLSITSKAHRHLFDGGSRAKFVLI